MANVNDTTTLTESTVQSVYHLAEFENFLDEELISSYSGVSYGVDRPTKYASNPVSGSASYTWDRTQAWGVVLTHDDWPEASRYRRWYQANEPIETPEVTQKYRVAYEYSSDGISWTRPNLGAVVYDGNTNNNLIFGENYGSPSVFYDPDGAAGQKYLLLLGLHDYSGSLGNGYQLYGSDSPDSGFSLIKTIRGNTSGNIATSIIKRSDGRFIAHGQHSPAVDQGEGLPFDGLRRIRAYLSDTTDPSGAWTDQGIVLDDSVVSTSQHYSVKAQVIGQLIYLLVDQYNASTERVTTRLYVSRADDGITTITQKDTTWLEPETSGSGAWDDEQVYANSLVRVGNTWRYYYSGYPIKHDAIYGGNPYYEARLGFAEIDFQRIGKISGTGTITTKTLWTKGDLILNCDASSGYINAEILDPDTLTPLSGYEEKDFDTITTDTDSIRLTWGGSAPDTSIPLVLKITLSNSTIYALNTGDKKWVFNNSEDLSSWTQGVKIT